MGGHINEHRRKKNHHELKDSPIDPLDLYLARFTQRLAMGIRAFVARIGTFYGDLAEISYLAGSKYWKPYMEVEMGRKMKTPSIVWA